MSAGGWMMWARVSTYSGSPDSIDEDTRFAKDKTLPQARQLPGFRGVYGLADRTTGKTVSITLWESEEAMRSSETEADRLRQEGTDHVGGSIVSVERFEVTLQELI